MTNRNGLKLMYKYPPIDRDGKLVAYDVEGIPLFEIVYKRGKINYRKEHTLEEKEVNFN